MIDILAPIFKDNWAPLGAGLVCREPVGGRNAHRLADLLGDPGEIDGILLRRSRWLGHRDLRPIASVWLLKYATLLVPPVAAAATILEHRFPVTLQDTLLIVDEHETPLKLVVPHLGEEVVGLDTWHRYSLLIHGHLEPLIACLSKRADLPEKILWGNVSRRLEAALGIAARHANPTVSQRAKGDGALLLEKKMWPGGQRNPMFGKKRKAMKKTKEGESEVSLHRQCCLKYLLPDEGYCGVCPLAPEFRKNRHSSGKA